MQFLCRKTILTWKMLRSITAIHHITTTVPRTVAVIRKSLVGKMRWYISRIEILITANAVPYTISQAMSVYTFVSV